MKKIQYPVVQPASSGAKFVDAITQIIGLWPTKLVPLIDEPPNPSKAFRKRWLVLAAQFLEPFENRDFAVVGSIKIDPGLAPILFS